MADVGTSTRLTVPSSISEGDPDMVHPSVPRAGTQAGLNGPGGSLTSPSERVFVLDSAEHNLICSESEIQKTEQEGWKLGEEDRIQYDDLDSEALGQYMAESAWPGVFSGGKQIIATAITQFPNARVLSLRFNDGSEMNIAGTFVVHYKHPAEGEDSPGLTERIEEGKRLLRGED